jgi:hypothetical protein
VPHRLRAKASESPRKTLPQVQDHTSDEAGGAVVH